MKLIVWLTAAAFLTSEAFASDPCSERINRMKGVLDSVSSHIDAAASNADEAVQMMDVWGNELDNSAGRVVPARYGTNLHLTASNYRAVFPSRFDQLRADRETLLTEVEAIEDCLKGTR